MIDLRFLTGGQSHKVRLVGEEWDEILFVWGMTICYLMRDTIKGRMINVAIVTLGNWRYNAPELEIDSKRQI